MNSSTDQGATEMSKTTKTQCDGKYSSCKRNATVTIPAGPFTGELHFCRAHERAFLQEATAFYGRNA